MGNLRAEFLLLCVVVLCTPFFVLAEEGVLEGSQTGGGIDQTPLEERCEPKGPYEEGEVCYFEEVSCLNGKKGLALSRCKSGQCVGTEACGIILPTQPTEIPEGTTPSTGQEPPPVPSTGGIPNPIPSSPTPTVPSGSGTGSGSGGAGGAGGGADPYTLPPVEVVQDPVPTAPPSTSAKPLPGWQGGSGTTFSTAPSVVSSGQSGGFGDGVYSGGNPFINPNGTTFTGSWSGPSGASGNLFSSFLSGIGNLISGLFGGSSTAIGGSSSSVQPSQPPRSSPQITQGPSTAGENSRETIDQQPRDPLEEFLDALENGTEQPRPLSPLDLPLPRNINGFPNTPSQSTDRSGISLDDVLESLTGRQNESPPLRLFPSGIDSPSVWEPLEPVPPPKPTIPVPTGGSGVAQGPGGAALPSSEGVSSRFNAERAVSETRAALETRSRYERFLDWINIGSPQSSAYAQALHNLAELTKEESLHYLAAAQGRLSVQVAEGGPVMTDAGLAVDIETSLSQEQRARFEAQYQEFVQKFDAVESDGDRERIVREYMERAIGDAQAAIDPKTRAELEKEGVTFVPPALPPVRSVPESSGLLAGLSSVGKRALEAVRGTWQSFFSPQPQAPTANPDAPATAPQAPTAPNPEPPTPPASAPNANAGRGFMQSGANFLGSLLQGLRSLFTNSGGASDNTGSTSQPQDPNPAASITANPPLINDGDTSVVAWSSVRASKCVLVDAALNVIAEGVNGTMVSPALSESTRFGVICDIAEGADKFVNETIVRVRGDETDPAPIFSHSGSVSNASGAGVSASAAEGTSAFLGTGEKTSVAPVDVRTCDPDQSIDSFIRCLCEAEPNAAGCTIPPGGL